MKGVTQVFFFSVQTFHAQRNNDAATCCRGPVFVYLGNSCHLQCILHYRHMKMNPLYWGMLRWCRTPVIHLRTRPNLRKKNNKIKFFKNYVPQKTCPHPSLDKIPPWLGAQVKIWLGLDDAKVINTTKVHPRWDNPFQVSVSEIYVV